MSGKIILNLAISLDGYIATLEDQYDWIHAYGDSKIKTEKSFNYQEFIQQIDCVLMGRRCYDMKMHTEFKGKRIIVASRNETLNDNDVIFYHKDIVQFALEEKNNGKRVYLFGGGQVIHPFIESNCIDEYIIGVIPIILGSGIPLFRPHQKTIPLNLVDYFIDDGMVIMKYLKITD